MKVLVLQGGDSPEHDISVKSAQNVITGLEQLGIEYVVFDPSEGFDEMEELAKTCDIAFPILHGVNGEDGVVQKQLESIGIPYLGADSKVSAVTINKVKTHIALENVGIDMPNYEVVTLSSFPRSVIVNKPFVLKHITGGSSLDTVIARTGLEDNRKECREKLEKYDEMLLEELVDGIEVTASVLDGEALPLIQIIPPTGEEFNFSNKYNGKSMEICPIPENILDNKLQEHIQNIALQAHKALGVRHLSRSEFIVDKNNLVYMLEINTIPGLTSASLYPKAAYAAGMKMKDLINMFVTMTVGEK